MRREPDLIRLGLGALIALLALAVAPELFSRGRWPHPATLTPWSSWSRIEDALRALHATTVACLGVLAFLYESLPSFRGRGRRLLLSLAVASLLLSTTATLHAGRGSPLRPLENVWAGATVAARALELPALVLAWAAALALGRSAQNVAARRAGQVGGALLAAAVVTAVAGAAALYAAVSRDPAAFRSIDYRPFPAARDAVLAVRWLFLGFIAFLLLRSRSQASAVTFAALASILLEGVQQVLDAWDLESSWRRSSVSPWAWTWSWGVEGAAAGLGARVLAEELDSGGTAEPMGGP
jgi:hypothetical protein